MGKKNEVMKQDSKVPAFLQGGGSRGNEEVSGDDIIIPQILIAQALSPQIDKTDGKYVEGLENGQLFNNITNDIYGKEVTVCPVAFKKEFVIFKDRKAGGGFYGSYATQEEANEARAAMDNPDQYEVVDSHQHFVLVINGDKIDEAVIIMTKTKCKVSRQWNTLVRMNGGDRFSRLYKLSSVQQENDQGKFNNFKVENQGWVTEELYKRAEQVYELVLSGVAKVAQAESDSDSEETPY